VEKRGRRISSYYGKGVTHLSHDAGNGREEKKKETVVRNHREGRKHEHFGKRVEGEIGGSCRAGGEKKFSSEVFFFPPR